MPQFLSFVLAIVLGVYFTLFHGNSTQFENDDDDLDYSTPETAKWVDNEEIRIFRKYLRFPTVTHDDDLGKKKKQSFISFSLLFVLRI